jgi:uncharacterized protein YdhG (YjbR/CyaY superfamily)
MVNQVEKYIEKQKSPQKEIVERIRGQILKTLPNIREEIKMGVPWYEGKFYVVALKDHVNLGFSVNGLTEHERVLFEGKGKFMRHVKFFSPQDIDYVKLDKLLRLVSEKSTCCELGY